MKRWIQKLISQFNFDEDPSANHSAAPAISEDRATLLYIIDTYNKHLLEVEGHPVRKVREILDEFARELLVPDRSADKLLFRFRQFFASYRIDEYAYLHKTFDDFRGIIWDFVDQLSEDLSHEQVSDQEVHKSLEDLREAVEANSVDLLKSQSRKFIDFYVEYQTRKDKRRTDRLHSVKRTLDAVRKQLFDTNQNMRLDHLTSAYNRKSFDEQILQHIRIHELSSSPLTLAVLDIDYFKRINDNFGHPIGDFVLKECVKTLQGIFNRDGDFVARIGGEEFAVILPETDLERAIAKADETLGKVRKDVFVHEGHQLRFTLSIGLAQHQRGETAEQLLKRADQALYKSKSNGRDRYSLAPLGQPEVHRAA